MGRSSKGSQFERQFAKRLSLWWTEGERDDVFWRSQQSGGRATQRSKSGKATFMQAGDIAAVDPIGLPLLQVITFELKRGYPKTSVADVFDKPNHAALQKWEGFWKQTTTSAEQNGSFGCMLVTRRDRREAMVWIPDNLARTLKKVGVPTLPIQFKHEHERIHGTTLDDWFERCCPDDFHDILEMTDGE